MQFMAFIELLADSGDEKSRSFASIGLATLHQYRAIRLRGGNAASDIGALASIRTELADLPASAAVHGPLVALVDALQFWDVETPNAFGRQLVYRALLGYGNALFAATAPELAVDVLDLVAIDAEIDGFDAIAAQARMLCGFAFRTLARWEESASAYDRAYELAWTAGEFGVALRARIGQANNAIGRGDLPRARALLHTVEKQAGRLAPEVLPRAISARANVENAAGRYEEAVALGYRALRAAGADPDTRMVVLVDLAQYFADVGATEVAAEALHCVIRSNLDLRHRLQAQLSLLALVAPSSFDGSDATFEALRIDLAEAPFTMRQRVLFHLHVAHGSRARGRYDEARAAAGAALALARTHELFQFMFNAEEELSRIDADAAAAAGAGSIPAFVVSEPTSTRVDRIARAVRTMLAVSA